MAAEHQVPVEEWRQRLARTAWLKILEAARRLRPLVDHLSFRDGDKDLSTMQTIGSTAFDSWAVLREFYNEAAGRREQGEPLGDVADVNRNLNEAMDSLLAIAGLGYMARGIEDVRVAQPGLRAPDLGSAIDGLVEALERQVGVEWHEADESIPERWAASTWNRGGV